MLLTLEQKMHRLERGLDFRIAESKSKSLISKSESSKTGLEFKSRLQYYKSEYENMNFIYDGCE